MLLSRGAVHPLVRTSGRSAQASPRRIPAHDFCLNLHVAQQLPPCNGLEFKTELLRSNSLLSSAKCLEGFWQAHLHISITDSASLHGRAQAHCTHLSSMLHSFTAGRRHQNLGHEPQAAVMQSCGALDLLSKHDRCVLNNAHLDQA